jgi:mRNA-degrading endonuclease RelE of RelBE toxin-antitoxin system
MPIRFTKAASKELRSLPRDIQRRMLLKLDWVSQDIDSRVEWLTGGTPKVRVGDYRLLCWISGDVLFISKIRHRREAYDEKRHGRIE